MIYASIPVPNLPLKHRISVISSARRAMCSTQPSPLRKIQNFIHQVCILTRGSVIYRDCIHENERVHCSPPVPTPASAKSVSQSSAHPSRDARESRLRRQGESLPRVPPRLPREAPARPAQNQAVPRENTAATAIATCRREDNGGKFSGYIAAELEVLTKAAESGFLSQTSNSSPSKHLKKADLQKLRETGIALIVSHHDFNATKDLEGIYDRIHPSRPTSSRSSPPPRPSRTTSPSCVSSRRWTTTPTSSASAWATPASSPASSASAPARPSPSPPPPR